MRYPSKPVRNLRCEFLGLVSGLFVFTQAIDLQANPTGGQVVSGAAQIVTTPGTVTINQSTTTASINWQDFSIASGELTRFQVPSSTSATLNRVTGGNISAIYGTLTSNGQLYLINPNGIVIGATGKIDTAGFLASTLNFSDTQFNQQGDLNLSGSSTAGISNEGTIHAATGDVYLIAAQVNNSGTITAAKGTVGLAAGNQVLLQKAGDQHLFVQVGATKTQATGVTNSGAIRAAAAELKVAGGNAYALAINNTGNIAATGIATINGQVYLTADGADISNSGTISAKQVNGNGGTIVVNAHSSAASTKGTLLNSGTIVATGTIGGTVELLGDNVGVTGRGVVDVSGSAGGGTALIGGDEHGANAAVPDADQTYLGPDATIKADALTIGSGGKVIVWSNEDTEVDGLISVHGGANGGDGGFVETSGAQLSVLTGPDIAALHGHGGMWLLDPSDITISDSGSPTVTQATLTTELESGSVTLDASLGSGGSGTITWTQTAGDPLNISNINGSSLVLNAPLSLTINGVTINGTGSLNLVMNEGAQQGNILITNSSLNLSGGDFSAEGVSATAGTPGVSITNNSTVTTGSGDIFIQGTGLVAAGSDATGVLISGSTVTCGSSSAPGTGSLEIDGNSDSGFTSNTPNSPFADNSYGVQVSDSTIASYSTNGLKINGVAYAANNLSSVGTELTGGTVIETFNGKAKIKGAVQPEAFGNSSGEANLAAGVQTETTQLLATGAMASIDLEADTSQVIANDDGDASVKVGNLGVYLLDNTTITASGTTTTGSAGVPISIVGSSGAAISSNSNSQQADSIGVWVDGGTTGATITNTGQTGAIAIAGAVDPANGDAAATGPSVAAAGVDIGSSNDSPVSVTAPNGGSIGILGLGGVMSAGSSSSFAGLAFGVGVQAGTVSTSTGSIAIMGAAGSTTGTLPSGSSVRLIGVGIVQGGTVETNLSTSGGTSIAHGGTVPPLILLYGTDSTLVFPVKGSNNPATFKLGSASDYAVEEDAGSTVITGNLVMGDFYDLFNAYGTSSDIAKAVSDLASYNSAISSSGVTLKGQTIAGFTFNPAGMISLISTTNQIANLSAVLDGSGGLSLNDSVNLTVGPIGDATGVNYAQINEAGDGPVAITMASNTNLTLSAISPFTNTSDGVPVISTSGLGNTITLTTSGTGQLINTAGASALTVAGGSNYIIYAASPADVTLDGIAAAQTLYNTTSPGAEGATSNTIAFASMAPVTGTDNLSGTAFIDSGSTPSDDTTIDLLFNGSLLGTTTTSGTGTFSFTVSTADLNSGILLTEPTNSGNTYFQATNPASSITGVDIWGGTLRVMASTANNLALGQVAGSLAMEGVNYSVTGSNLATNAGVNVLILPNTSYTLDGNITASGTLTTGANATLGSSATGTVTLTGTNIALGGSLTSAGSVQFSAEETGSFTSPGTITDSGPVQVGGFILQNGTWRQIVGQDGLTALPAFNVTNNFELQGSSTFERFAGFDDGTGAYEIADLYGLQGLASPSGNLLGVDAELAGNINAAGTASWNNGAGFIPIGTGSSPYSGTFNGQGFSIDGLSIHQPTTSEVGLFGELGAGDSDGAATVENLGVTNIQVSGGSNSDQDEGPDVGGVVGENFGTISKVYVTGTVNAGSDSSDAGGLVAYNDGTIDQSYSTVAVNGYGYTGGLVGDNAGSVRDSFSIGPVTAAGGSQDVGGLVGFNEGTIHNTYSAGMVSVGEDSSFVGALIGANNSDGSEVDNSFWDTSTAGTGVISGVGSDQTPNTTPGVRAATTGQLESQAFITANSPTEPTFDFSETWTTYGDTLTPQLIGLPIAGQVPSNSGPGVLTVNPNKQVNDALYSIVPFPLFEPIPNVNIIGGAGGVAGDGDYGSDVALEKRLERKYGRTRAEELLAIIQEDRKDGSTVNTGTLAPKWAANTGLSKLLRLEETAQISQGLTQSQFNSPLIFNLFQEQVSPEVRNELGQAAQAGAKGDHGP